MSHFRDPVAHERRTAQKDPSRGYREGSNGSDLRTLTEWTILGSNQ